MAEVKNEIFKNKELQEIPTKKAIKKVYPSIIKDFKKELITKFNDDIKCLDFETKLNVKLELNCIDSSILISLDTKENTINAWYYYKQRKMLIKNMVAFITSNYEHLKDYDYTITDINEAI